MRAAIYSRKSRFTGKGESIENQVQMCKEYIKRNFPEETYDFQIFEDEGFSGGNINRPEFQRLLKEIKNKKFDVLICYRLDRISRNVSDFSSTLEMLQDYDVDFISIKEQFDTSTPMGRAMVYISSVFAQLERETIAERIRDNMLELAKSGRWLGGQTPLGFESERITYLDSEFKERSMCKLKPVEKELNLVKLIYDKYLEAGSIHMVLKYLLSNNIRGKNGGDFASMSVNDILRNPVYVKSNETVFKYFQSNDINTCGTPNGNGILIYNKKNSKYKLKDKNEWIAAVSRHKGVISSDKWLEVQRNLDKNSKKINPRQGTSKKALLSGILKCAKCGAPMRVSYGRPKKNGEDRIYYYMCSMKAHSGKTRCNNPNVRGDYLEKQIVEEITHLDRVKVMEDLMERRKEALKGQVTSPITNVIKNIEQKKKEMDSLLSQLSKLDNSVASEFIIGKIDELGKEIKALEKKLINADKAKEEIEVIDLNIKIIFQALDEFTSFFNSMDSLKKDEQTVKRKRYLLERIMDSIEYDGTTKKTKLNMWGSKKK